MTMIITGVSGEHRRQDRVLEPVRKMFGLDEEVEGALGYRGICLMVCSQSPAAMNPKCRTSSLELAIRINHWPSCALG